MAQNVAKELSRGFKGKTIRILPRPGGHFSLEVDGKNTTIRIRRVK
jgi:hypothetical protein